MRHGTERVPADGGLLLVANHPSLFDPVVLGYIMPRRIEFMAMTELFRHPVVAALLRALGAFPVDRRRHATGAVREALLKTVELGG